MYAMFPRKTVGIHISFIFLILRFYRVLKLVKVDRDHSAPFHFVAGAEAEADGNVKRLVMALSNAKLVLGNGLYLRSGLSNVRVRSRHGVSVECISPNRIAGQQAGECREV